MKEGQKTIRCALFGHKWEKQPWAVRNPVTDERNWTVSFRCVRRKCECCLYTPANNKKPIMAKLQEYLGLYNI
jgi:hypothetical protein